MMTKRKKFVFILLIIITAVCYGFPIMGANEDNASREGEAVLTTISLGSIKKRMPLRNDLKVSYGNETIYLSSDYFQGEFLLLFENRTTSETFYLPSISVGESKSLYLSYGEYIVYAESNDGVLLSGIMTIL